MIYHSGNARRISLRVTVPGTGTGAVVDPRDRGGPVLVSRCRSPFVPISPSRSPTPSSHGTPPTVAAPSPTIRKPVAVVATVGAQRRTKLLAMVTSRGSGDDETVRRLPRPNPLLGFGLDPRQLPAPPLKKSWSAPAALLHDDSNRQPFNPFDPPSPSGPAPYTGTTPRGTQHCKNKECDSVDENDLELGPDSQYVCNRCGTVAGQHMVSLHHQKACALEADPTATGDEVARDSANEAVAAAARGPETGAERRRRLVAGAGGSRIGKSVVQRLAIGGAHSRVETAASRDVLRRINGDVPALTQKFERVIVYVQAAFSWIGRTLAERVCVHVRMETRRLIATSETHEGKCRNRGSCNLCLSKRSNQLIANCAFQVCLERLRELGADDRARALAAHGCTDRELDEHLSRLKQLHSQTQGHGQVPQIVSAVRVLLNWDLECTAAPCCAADVAPSPPPLLVLPPPLLVDDHRSTVDSPGSAASSESFGEASGVALWRIRDVVTGAAERVNARADVRVAALSAIAQNQVLVEWMRARSGVLPMDVLGVALLGAVASNLGMHDCTGELLAQTCYEHSVSPHAAREASTAMAAIAIVEPSAGTGVFGDGIF